MLATIEPAIASNPDLSDLRYLLGVAYEKTGQRKKAVRPVPGGPEVLPEPSRGQRGTRSSAIEARVL